MHDKFLHLVAWGCISALTACGGGPAPQTAAPYGPTPAIEALLESGAPNVLPVQVGGSNPEVNVPLVSVTLCVPGTSTCAIIPRIQLDTGSSGLRIDADQVKLSLPPVLAAAGKTVGNCVAFGGGDAYWGGVVSADVVLGGEWAASVPVQLIDPTWNGGESTCGTTATLETNDRYNGILGVGPSVSEKYGDSYYSCSGTSQCSALTNAAPAIRVQNPVALLPADHNGVIVLMPAVSDSGATSLTGAVILGIGTQANNGPWESPVVIPTQDDWFSADLGGSWYPAMVDSGTNSFALPSAFTSIPPCTGLQAYVCPASHQPLSISIGATDNVPLTTAAVNVADAASLLDSTNLAFDDLAESWGGEMATTVVMGMPFFYGRAVYFGIDGETGPLGAGPFVAF